MPPSTPTDPICPACGGRSEFREFTAREMMFGLREQFAYRECQRCGSLHIKEVPADLARFYPANYYSFQKRLRSDRLAALKWLKRVFANWVVTSPGAGAQKMAESLAYHRRAFLYWVRLCGLKLDSRILDLGCGSGILLSHMRAFGFSELTGADPFAPTAISESGFRIFQSELAALNEQFDLIMMHHTLEHVADPLQTMIGARERLRPGGRILIRIPLAGSEAHRRYGADWFNLDAPRHLAIPSGIGMEHLAKRAGLTILHRGFDSVASGFFMSENYRNNRAGNEAPKPARSVKRAFRKLAHECDRKGQGDAGVFVLGVAK